MDVVDALIPTAALLQAVSTVQDTVVTVAAESTGWKFWVDMITSIASTVIALALIAIAIPLVPAAWNSRKVYAKVLDGAKRLRGDLDPAVRHVNDIAENVNYVTTAVRTDVERLKLAVAEAQQRLDQLVSDAHQRLDRNADLAEERIREFNALLQVMQEEAEGLFIGTASLARGVRAGVLAYAQGDDDADWEEDAEWDEDADWEEETEPVAEPTTIRVVPRRSAEP